MDQSLSEPQDLSRRFAPPPPVRYPGYPPPPPPLIKTERECSSPAPAEVTVKTEPEDPGYGQVFSDNYQDRDLARSFSLPARELDQQPVERQLSLDRARHHQGGKKEEGGSSRTIIGSVQTIIGSVQTIISSVQTIIGSVQTILGSVKTIIGRVWTIMTFII